MKHIKSRLVWFENHDSDHEWWRTAHIDPHAATSTPPYTGIERLQSEFSKGSATSTPETKESSARVRLKSAMRDWFSQKQSTSVIYAQAYRLRWALEDATKLDAVTDEEADDYKDILKSAPPSGELKFRATDEHSLDGADTTI